MSSLWMGLLRVVERDPKRRPWKPDLNDRMDMCGEPGDLLFIAEEISSAEKSTSGPPRS